MLYHSQLHAHLPSSRTSIGGGYKLTLFSPCCFCQHSLLHSCFLFPLLPAPQLLFSHLVEQDLLLLFIQLCQELRVDIHITQNLLQHDYSKSEERNLLPTIFSSTRRSHLQHSRKQPAAKEFSLICQPSTGSILLPLSLLLQAYSAPLLLHWQSSLLISSTKGSDRCRVKWGGRKGEWWWNKWKDQKK